MQVAVLMGSKSDWVVMQKTVNVLKSFGIEPDVRVISAHRTPEDLDEYMKATGAQAFICGAGGAAHLAGAVAARTLSPVVGVPIANSLQGFDALLATVQMPAGIPVATVAVDGAANAAILVAQMLAINDDELKLRLVKDREARAQKVHADNDELQHLAGF